MVLEEKKQRASEWFRQLRDMICAGYEAIEAEYDGDGEPGRFTITPWERPEGGGGEMGMMKGRVFEKVGVNISIVEGMFDEKFRREIPGASDDPRYWAAGISLVAHMHSPLVPAAHFNTRMIVVGGESQAGQETHTKDSDGPEPASSGEQEASQGSNYKLWFGGGGDLNPMYPVDQDTADFHQALQAACDAFDPAFYPAFRDWCDEYFYIPHRDMTRGVGGIFYDYLGLNTLCPHPLPGGEGSARDAHANAEGKKNTLSNRERSAPHLTSPRKRGEEGGRLGEDRIDLSTFGKGGVGKEKTQAGMEIAANAALDWEQAFALTQDVGRAFHAIYPALIRRHMYAPWTQAQREWQLQKRGRYAEYNLLYDRGTRFGLMTGGNTEAILMSLPPVAKWP